jgi:hypothetical protein
MASRKLGNIDRPPRNDAPNQPSQPLRLLPLLGQIPHPIVFLELVVERRVHLLMHQAEIPTAHMAASNLEELGSVKVESSEDLAPLSGEVVGL